MIPAGYPTVGSYKVYNLYTKNIIASIYITINEKEGWNWQKEDVEPSSSEPFEFHYDLDFE